MDSNNIEKGLELIGQEMNQKLIGNYGDDGKLLAIDKEEMEVGIIQIDEMHPLSKKGLGEILPYLCCCMKKSKSNMMRTESNSQMDQLFEDEMKETSERLDKIIADQGAEPYEGSDFIPPEEDGNPTHKSNNSKGKKKKDDDSEDGDPFNDFGFGIVAYFTLLRTLIGVFLLMSILMCVPIYLYRTEGDPTDKAGVWV